MSAERESIIKLGVPKGSLEEATINLFERAGWKIRKHTRNYFPDINDPEITASLCRVQEIGGYIEAGVLDVGITGLDWLFERGHGDAVERIADLVYSKTSNRPCRWVLAVAGDSPYMSAGDLAGKRIATELEGLTRRYFAQKGVDVDVFYSWGATEAKVVEGLADGIVEVTETGTTIRAHGLRIIDQVMLSHPVLIANKHAWKDPAQARQNRAIEPAFTGRVACGKSCGHKNERPGRQSGRYSGNAAFAQFPHGFPFARRALAFRGNRGPGRHRARFDPAPACGRGRRHYRVCPEQGDLGSPRLSAANPVLWRRFPARREGWFSICRLPRPRSDRLRKS